MKRIFDIFFSSAALIVFLIPLAFLLVLVRLKLGGPIFFRQVRPGLNGQPFEMIKFRTMTNERDKNGALLPDAKRLTLFGRKLRTTSLDELPELWNVLRGEMSLVGPRPLLMEYLEYYSPEESLRHTVRPGITGLAQINGRNTSSWNDRLAFDIYYVKNRSIFMDIRILFLTVVKVFTREGVVVVPSTQNRKLSEERKK